MEKTFWISWWGEGKEEGMKVGTGRMWDEEVETAEVEQRGGSE